MGRLSNGPSTAHRRAGASLPEPLRQLQWMPRWCAASSPRRSIAPASVNLSLGAQAARLQPAPTAAQDLFHTPCGLKKRRFAAGGWNQQPKGWTLHSCYEVRVVDPSLLIFCSRRIQLTPISACSCRQTATVISLPAYLQGIEPIPPTSFVFAVMSRLHF
jgi:hypothetical protein